MLSALVQIIHRHQLDRKRSVISIFQTRRYLVMHLQLRLSCENAPQRPLLIQQPTPTTASTRLMAGRRPSRASLKVKCTPSHYITTSQFLARRHQPILQQRVLFFALTRPSPPAHLSRLSWQTYHGVHKCMSSAYERCKRRKSGKEPRFRGRRLSPTR